MMKSVVILLLIAFGVQSMDILTEMAGSGDGNEPMSTTVNVSLIDDNGDISPFVTPLDNDTSPESVDQNSTISVAQVETTTIIFTTSDSNMDFKVANDSQTTVSATDAPTTITTTDSATMSTTPTAVTTTSSSTSSTSSTTTTTTTTTTEPPPTTTTTTKKPTTTRASTTTMIQKTTTKQTTTKVYVMPTAPTLFPHEKPQLCSFLDSDLICDEEIVCYGEGEIDCTNDDDDIVLEETSMLDKISLTPISEDYSDYDASGESIGTFPPSLIGGKKKTNLFRMGSLGNDLSSENSSETVDAEATEMTTVLPITSTSPVVELVSDVTKDSNNTTEAVEVKFPTQDSELIEERMFEETDFQLSPVNFTDGNLLERFFPSNETIIEGIASTEQILTTEQMPTTEGITSTEQLAFEEIVMNNETATQSTLSNASVTESVLPLVRRKREDSPSSLSSSSLKRETSKKKEIKKCRLTGNLSCSPTHVMCRGKTFCQEVQGTVQTSGKPTQQGVQNWTIAVIAICAIAASLTVVLLVYLLVTSCKKLKVQPHGGVTPLNYVNSGAQP